MQDFFTEEKNTAGEPLCSGKFIDFGVFPLEEDNINDLNIRQKKLVEAVRSFGTNYKPPYIVMDLATVDDIKLVVENEKYKDDFKEKKLTEEAKKNPALKFLISASEIVDLSSISDENMGGMSVVKCNPSIPVYRWFQAANLMLGFCDQLGRVVPFPMDQDNGMTTYHFLRVNPREYMEYQKLLEFCVAKHGVEEGFNISSKYSYECLSARGIKKITHDEVDKTLTHVMLMKDSKMRGVLLHNAGREELDTEEIKKKHFIYY
jgi:hypothetical protein